LCHELPFKLIIADREVFSNCRRLVI